MSLESWIFLAVVVLGIRKFWKWVKLRNEQIDYENGFIAELRQAVLNGEIKWPRS